MVARACSKLVGIISTLLLAGCATTEIVPYAYRIPLEANSHGPSAAASCVSLCQEESKPTSVGFYACLESCPDLDVERRVCAPPPDPSDNPPAAACFTRMTKEEVPSAAGEAIGEAIAEMLGHAVVAVAQAAVDNAAESSSSSSNESHERHASHHRTEPSSRSASRSYVAAKPRRVN
jgi:hypothetical protein